MLEAILAVLLLNGLGFLSAFLMQTDKLTDLLYSTSFVTVVIVMWFTTTPLTIPSIWLGILVLVWAIRLGGYLFWRIHAIGRDVRFDEMRPSFRRFMGFWLLQTISILIIALPLLLTGGEDADIGPVMYVGTAIWFIGFLLETIADVQKFVFKKAPENAGRFISHGVWKRMRHPNYLGEIMVWLGIFLVSVPLLDGYQWIAVLSPAWIFVLLRFISGIPLLEEKAQDKYGSTPEYAEYMKSTYRLWPKF